MPIEYDTFPLKKFWKILEDEALLSEYEIEKEDWEKLKEEWNEKHPTADTTKIVEASRKVILEDMRLKSYILLGRVISQSEDDCKEFYEALGIKHHDTIEERMAHIQKEINKSQQKLSIFAAQKKKLMDGLKVDEKTEEENRTDLNEVLASFEIAGISVGSYEEMTLGRYDGLNKAFERKASKESKNGG